MNKYEIAILRILLKNQSAIQKRSLVNGFPNVCRNKVLAAITKLQDLDYIHLNFITSGYVYVLNKTMKEDAKRLVSRDYAAQRVETPREDLIPNVYKKKPLFTSKGEKLIHGNVSDYSFHTRKNKKDEVMCYVFNKHGISNRINLGSLFDGQSMISIALKTIDEKFGKNPFLKHELKNTLPQEIAGNRQPVKAITEYLCYEKFLVRLSGSKFQRTGKVHQIDTLDEVKVKSKAEMPTVSMLNDGKTVYYTEEEGLYTSFY